MTADLSHPLIRAYKRDMKSHPEQVAQQFVSAMHSLGEDIKYNSWQLAELIYWLHYHKLWQYRTYTFIDPDTGQEIDVPPADFAEYCTKSKDIPVSRDQAYRLRGTYETIAIDLGIKDPHLLHQCLTVSFDKIYFGFRKLQKKNKLTTANLQDWIAIANASGNDLETFLSIVDQHLLPTNINDDAPAILTPRRYKLKNLSLDDLRENYILDLLDLDDPLPPNAVVTITLQIKFKPDEENNNDDQS